MTTYYITVLLVLFFLYFAQKYSVKSINSVTNEIIIIKPFMTRFFFSLAVIILIFVAGFRYYVGADYGSYYGEYLRFANSFWESLKNFDEPGYGLIALINPKSQSGMIACLKL